MLINGCERANSKSWKMPKLYLFDKHLAALLMLSFFLPARVQVFMLIPVCSFFALRDVFTAGRIEKRKLGYAIFLSSLYLLYTAYLPFTPKPFADDLRFHLEGKAALLLFPLLMACLSRTTVHTILTQLHWFVIGCVVSCLAGNILFVSTHMPFTDVRFLNHVAYRLSFESITGVHPTYMGMYLCFAVAILLFQQGMWQGLRPWQLGVVLFVLFACLFALFPKTPIIALLLTLVYYTLLHLRDWRKCRVPLIALCVSMLVAFLIPFSSQRAAELQGFFPMGGIRNPIDNSISMRQIIWKMDVTLLQKSWLSGVGPGRIRMELMQLYFALSKMTGIPLEYYDTHNEYLNIWISFGVIGLFLFLCILGVQLFRAIKNKHHLYICLLATLCICFMTENVLANQRGVVFYAFFTALLFFAKEEPRVFNDRAWGQTKE